MGGAICDVGGTLRALGLELGAYVDSASQRRQKAHKDDGLCWQALLLRTPSHRPGSEPALIGWHVCHTSLGGDGAPGIPHAVPVLVAHVIVVFL